MLAALYLGWTLSKADDALAMAATGIKAVIDASAGADELRLVASADAWARPEPSPVIVHRE
jgi:hypothetical protein